MFEPIEFTPDLMLGNPVLDAQHREIICIYNDFLTFININGVETNETKKELHHIIDKLFNYVQKHFDYEEMYMAKHGYSDLEKHKFEHLAIAEKLTDYCLEIFGTTDIIHDFVLFFESWIVTHIKKSDFDFIYSTRKNKQIVLP